MTTIFFRIKAFRCFRGLSFYVFAHVILALCAKHKGTELSQSSAPADALQITTKPHAT